jgi:protein arginine kinase activator
MTKIINNKKIEMHLCEECAGKRNDFQWFAPFSINDLLSSLVDIGKPSVVMDRRSTIRCDSCGLDYSQFKKTGRLGCLKCYNVFNNELAPIIGRIQKGMQHTGKIPKRTGAELRVNREIETLKAQLKAAVEREAFEEAARLRDRIRELENKRG